MNAPGKAAVAPRNAPEGANGNLPDQAIVLQLIGPPYEHVKAVGDQEPAQREQVDVERSVQQQIDAWQYGQKSPG